MKISAGISAGFFILQQIYFAILFHLCYNKIVLTLARNSRVLLHEKSIMGDIVVRTHIPTRNGIPYEKLTDVLRVLVFTLYPDTESAIGFDIGTENEQGINAIQIRTNLNQWTQNHLQDILHEIFGQRFEISYNDVDTTLHRRNELNKAKQSLLAKYTSSGTPAL